jgi:hypothetical protein
MRKVLAFALFSLCLASPAFAGIFGKSNVEKIQGAWMRDGNPRHVYIFTVDEVFTPAKQKDNRVRYTDKGATVWVKAVSTLEALRELKAQGENIDISKDPPWLEIGNIQEDSFDGFFGGVYAQKALWGKPAKFTRISYEAAQAVLTGQEEEQREQGGRLRRETKRAAPPPPPITPEMLAAILGAWKSVNEAIMQPSVWLFAKDKVWRTLRSDGRESSGLQGLNKGLAMTYKQRDKGIIEADTERNAKQRFALPASVTIRVVDKDTIEIDGDTLKRISEAEAMEYIEGKKKLKHTFW